MIPDTLKQGQTWTCSRCDTVNPVFEFFKLYENNIKVQTGMYRKPCYNCGYTTSDEGTSYD